MTHHPATIGFISLGCPKATVDSERILTQLRAEGYLISPSYAESDLVVVNTCGFINSAIEESLEAIGEALTKNGRVIVTGCLGVNRELINKHYPQLLAITGPNALEDIMTAIHQQLPPPHTPRAELLPLGGIKLTPRHYAYLKISEGCNQSCGFCIIPTLRGHLVSRPCGEVLAEAELLVKAGVRELLLVSQDTASYGIDLKYQTNFWRGRPVKSRITDLVEAMGRLGVWVRLHYVYPYPHVDKLIELMAEELLLPYLDIPLQHSSPAILKAMRRPVDSENMLNRIAQWRRDCPELTLRSTFIVGFPGETEQDFEHLLGFLKAAQLDRVGAFAYSAVEGAAANALPGQVPEEVKAERLDRFMEVQSEISTLKLEQRIGQTVRVLVDEVTSEMIYARSAAESPEIDGMIMIANQEDDFEESVSIEVLPGEWLEVVIVDADEHDLYAEVVD